MSGTRARSPIEAMIQSESISSDATDAAELGLCDLSPVDKLGVKGPQAETWLHNQGIQVPKAIYDIEEFADKRNVVRSGTNEFILQDLGDTNLDDWRRALAHAPAGVYPFEHESAVFGLTGRRARQVLAQTCSVDFAQAADNKIIYTRVAGATCAITPQCERKVPRYVLWVDFGTAPYLWQTLLQIVTECGGRVVAPL